MDSGRSPQRIGRSHSRTSEQISRLMGGRPFGRCVERRVHRRRSQSRCQPTTVSGRTSTTAVRQLLQTRRRAIQNSRSRACKWGRLVARFIAISCCRSARFSSTSSRCPRSPSASARPTTTSSSSMSRSWLPWAPESTQTGSGEGQVPPQQTDYADSVRFNASLDQVIAGVAQLPGVDSVVPILFCQAHGVAIGVGRRLRDRGGRPRCGHGDALGLSR